MDDKIKNLEAKFEKAVDYKEKIDILTELSSVFGNKDIDKAISYIKIAAALALAEKEEGDHIDLRIRSIELLLFSKNFKEAFKILE